MAFAELPVEDERFGLRRLAIVFAVMLATLLATSQAIMVESFPASQIGMAQAIFGVGVMIGPSLGPTLGGWITDHYTWRWIFFINLPLGLLAAFMCIMALEDPETMKARKAPSVDWAGIALLIVAVGSLQMVLERGHRLDWFESREITTFTILAVAGAIAFVWRELTAEHPVVDLRVLKHRSLAVGCTYGTLIGLGLYGSIFLFPVYTQTLLRWTAWQSGLAALPSSIATAIMMGFAGRLSRGSGLGAMFVPLSVATLGGLPMAAIPQGAGLYSLFRQLGGSAGVALLATILEQRTAVHRAQLADHVSLLDAETWTRLSTLTAGFMQRGLDLASAQTASLTLLAGTLKAQASMLAFSDCYRFVLLLFVVCTPLAFLLRRPALFRPPA